MKEFAELIPPSGERAMDKGTGRKFYPTHEELAELAYRLYESRGRQDGEHVADWLRAEEELERHYA